MKRLFFSVSFAALAGVLALPAVAQAYPCADLNANSCWSVVNESSQPLSLRCDFRIPRTDRWYAILEDLEVAPGETFSHQFDISWADGLGYGSNGASGVCTFAFAGMEREVEVDPIGFGARVQAKLSRRGRASVTVRESWGGGTTVYPDSRR